jgi:hypothetical protein
MDFTPIFDNGDLKHHRIHIITKRKQLRTQVFRYARPNPSENRLPTEPIAGIINKQNIPMLTYLAIYIFIGLYGWMPFAVNRYITTNPKVPFHKSFSYAIIAILFWPLDLYLHRKEGIK